MHKVKSIGAGLLLVLGFWCLGRALETALNSDPRVVDKRETLTAGILLGIPATATAGWLLWDRRRQSQLTQEKHLRAVFFQVVQAQQGQITPLQFAIAAQISGQEAKAYLSDRSLEFDATFQVDEVGNIFYCFPLSPGSTRLVERL
jgi:hypothetical protein